MLHLRSAQLPWEVIESIGIDPVSQYHDEDEFFLNSVSRTDISGTYIFEVPANTSKQQSKWAETRRNALRFSRKEMLKQVKPLGYNILLVESWHLTVTKRLKVTRIEITYKCRPANALDELVSSHTAPPFSEILTMPRV
ncbi:hypothetical protein DL96DRAFT_1702369 [Flagelloscypha sp. PMI_526]|nr:hypothetical protein DL96DRAFT_1702369 [Flagelloscypha sp. PMI_526]